MQPCVGLHHIKRRQVNKKNSRKIALAMLKTEGYNPAGIGRMKNALQSLVENMPRVIAVANQKGGVGKTTCAMNLSVAIAVAGYRTLLIDIDPQANTTSGLGVDKERLVTVMNVLLNPDKIESAILEDVCHGLDMIPSNAAVANVEQVLLDQQDRNGRLAKAVGRVVDSYDFVLIDCPPSLGVLTRNALGASDSVLIPIQCEYYAMEGLSQIVGAVKKARGREGTPLVIEGIVCTMYDGAVPLCREVVEEIEQYFPDEIYRTKIPREVELSEAPSFGKSVLDYDLRSRGARAYIELAKEVIARAT